MRPLACIQVVVTGAAGNIGYAILFMVAAGRMAGHDQPLELRLLDLPNMENVLKGVVMELHDCAFPLVTSVIATSDYKTVRPCGRRFFCFCFSFSSYFLSFVQGLDIWLCFCLLQMNLTLNSCPDLTSYTLCPMCDFFPPQPRPPLCHCGAGL